MVYPKLRWLYKARIKRNPLDVPPTAHLFTEYPHTRTDAPVLQIEVCDDLGVKTW